MLKVCHNSGYLGITNLYENLDVKEKTKLNFLLNEDKLENIL
jgi:hypothetical protein